MNTSRTLSLIGFLVGIFGLVGPLYSEEWADLLTRSERGREMKYGQFEERGGKILPTTDGRSFYLLLAPVREAAVVVPLHAPSTWAIDGVEGSSAATVQRGEGILAVQWKIGEEADAALSGDDVLREIDTALTANHLAGRRIVLLGAAGENAIRFDPIAIEQFTASVQANGGTVELEPPHQ